jgi:hypothetical protein
VTERWKGALTEIDLALPRFAASDDPHGRGHSQSSQGVELSGYQGARYHCSSPSRDFNSLIDPKMSLFGRVGNFSESPRIIGLFETAFPRIGGKARTCPHFFPTAGNSRDDDSKQ